MVCSAAAGQTFVTIPLATRINRMHVRRSLVRRHRRPGHTRASRGRARSVWTLVGLMLVATSCTSAVDEVPPDDTTSDASEPSSAPDPRIRVRPIDGADDVTPNQPVRVRVTNGRLATVKVRTASGDRLRGRMSDDKTRWTSAQRLGLDKRYTVRAKATNPDGRTVSMVARFATAAPRARLHTAIAPLDGETVGVGMPVDVRLSAEVENRAAVERALKVSAEPAVTGSWHWLSDSHLRYRPKSYWKPGTDVSVRVRLTGVNAGGGVWGDETRTVNFTVGDKMVSVVDDASQQMKVYQNGTLLRTIPISDGMDGFRTRSGIKVIMLKHRTYDFNSGTIGIDPASAQGYDLSNVPYSMRLTNSGEFLHAAPWREGLGLFGQQRASHGCIGMTTADARWLYEHSRRGDVVKVVNSPAPAAEIANGYGGWNVSWSQWKAGSALR